MTNELLTLGMYVRCPADREYPFDPRTFVCGQVVALDNQSMTAKVKMYDPFHYCAFFEDLPSGIVEYPIDSVHHCSLFIGSDVVLQGKTCKVLIWRTLKTGQYAYYLQDNKTKQIIRAAEKDIIASLTNGHIDPTEQLKAYEFQNPCWYFGHAVVSKSMNILNNSIYGFKELAGSKIYLLPHQVNTIMRCLQEEPCRYMLADEVGMGKTVEAISVLKIYMQNRTGIQAAIFVPDQLVEQWKKELLLKFNIPSSVSKDGNIVYVKPISDISLADGLIDWDFVIIDEVHRFLSERKTYSYFFQISKKAKNLLLLSATPVQQRKEEYLSLLCLLQPTKYANYSEQQFATLIKKQSKIIQKTALILDDLNDFEETVEEVKATEKSPQEYEDCIELFEEISEYLSDICDELNDQKLTALLEQIDFNAEDCGAYKIKVIISYICSNYQIESHIIRNRRRILEATEEGERLLPTRELRSISYQLDQDRNTYEAVCYDLLSDWITENASQLDIQKTIQPLLSAFFSSPWAFTDLLQQMNKSCVITDEIILENARNWTQQETYSAEHIQNIIDDPDAYPSECCSRLVSVINYLYDEAYDKKVVLFTNYAETFTAYRKALTNLFDADEISFFGAGMPPDELEMNAFRFQTEEQCRIMLCDYTGGEGRNFQCADYVVHIDLPWDASMIEQRIGRLDRLERDKSRSVVTSVVIYAEDSFESALLDFWSKGLKIFTQSLSGMEIIMKDINHEIISAVKENFQYGLFERIPTIIQQAEQMRNAIRKEHSYDAAGFIFKPMYAELRRLIEYYARNENDLFAETMMNWASLPGFRGYHNENGTITYSASSFSPKSAVNSQLIPPRWAEYLDSESNRFYTKIQEDYERAKSIHHASQSLIGTFSRKTAIENDYLHFFAPGDEVFDCITNNAINSCKGKASAFAVSSALNWKGFIFKWSLTPNEAYLFDNGISMYALSPYRNYMMTEQVTIVISVENFENYTDSELLQEYQRIIKLGFKKGKTVHLGKRSHEAKYLSKIIEGDSNIAWFKRAYPEEIWHDLVSNVTQEAKEKALEKFRRRSNIKGAHDEMERTLSARAANSAFYGIGDTEIAKLEQEQKLILDAIRSSKVTLDSAAFVWMVKEDVGDLDA